MSKDNFYSAVRSSNVVVGVGNDGPKKGMGDSDASMMDIEQVDPKKGGSSDFDTADKSNNPFKPSYLKRNLQRQERSVSPDSDESPTFRSDSDHSPYLGNKSSNEHEKAMEPVRLITPKEVEELRKDLSEATDQFGALRIGQSEQSRSPQPESSPSSGSEGGIKFAFADYFNLGTNTHKI